MRSDKLIKLLEGGAIDPSYAAMVNALLVKNKDKNFVSRILNPNPAQSLPDPENPGMMMSHKMSYSGIDDGRAIAYPEVVEQNGQLQKLDPQAAVDHAYKTKEAIVFPNEPSADWFTKNYKTPQFLQEMKSKKFAGKIKKARYGLSMEDEMLPGPTVTAQRPYTLGPNQDHNMQGIQPYNPAMQKMEMPAMSQITPGTPPSMGTIPAGDGSAAPKKKGFGFTTPGTGDLISGMVGMANALFPEQQPNNYHNNQYGGYNPNAYGNGSQAIMDAGGSFPGGTYTKTRKSGGFTVTEEIPKNLGYGLPAISNGKVGPAPAPVPTKSLGYEKLDMAGRPVYSPKFIGPWTEGEIRNNWSNIPEEMGGAEVLRGDAWMDAQQGDQFSRSNAIPNSGRESYEEAYFPPGYFGQMKQGGKIPPVYVQDKNDPRYKAYKDSLNAYNRYSKFEDPRNLSEIKDYPGSVVRVLGNKIPYNEAPEYVEDLGKRLGRDMTKFDGSYDNNDANSADEVGGGFSYKKSDIFRKEKVKPDHFRPIDVYKTGPTGQDEDRIYQAVYKKPVQPVLIGRPDQPQPTGLPMVGSHLFSSGVNPSMSQVPMNQIDPIRMPHGIDVVGADNSKRYHGFETDRELQDFIKQKGTLQNRGTATEYFDTSTLPKHKNGGKFKPGQSVNLTVAERLQLEAQGYKFK